MAPGWARIQAQVQEHGPFPSQYLVRSESHHVSPEILHEVHLSCEVLLPLTLHQIKAEINRFGAQRSDDWKKLGKHTERHSCEKRL